MAEDTEVGSLVDGSDCEDKTVKRSSLTFKNSNRATGYLTSSATQAFTQLR